MAPIRWHAIHLLLTFIFLGYTQANLPRQSLEVVGDEILSINNYWEFIPDFKGEPESRPIMVFLHGNCFKERNKPKTIVTSELSGARLFAKFPDDFELENMPQAVSMRDLNDQERLLRGFRFISEKYQWQAMVVCPILAIQGPWVASDVVKFVDNYVRKKHGARKRIYLVGASIGGFGALRVIEYVASLGVKDSMFAAVSVASPGCGSMAGPHFMEDPYCVMPRRLVDNTTLEGIAEAFAVLRVPLLIYQGNKDKAVPMTNSLNLMELVNNLGGWAAVRVVKEGMHGELTWYSFFARDFSMYAWLMQHDLPVPNNELPVSAIRASDLFQTIGKSVIHSDWFQYDPIARPRKCDVASGGIVSNSNGVVFPCIPIDSVESWGVGVVSEEIGGHSPLAREKRPRATGVAGGVTHPKPSAHSRTRPHLSPHIIR